MLSPQISLGKLPPSVDAARLQQRIAATMRARTGNIRLAQKTTAGGERLRAEAVYTAMPSPVDSIVFIYSGGRSSEFNYDWIGYDYEEAAGDYYPVQFGNPGYVAYDSLNYYDFSGSSNYETPGIRSYNGAGSVVRAIKGDDIVLFSYDPAGRLAMSLSGGYDAATNVLDSSYRDFYFYNAAGHLIKDSVEIMNPGTGTWMTTGNYLFTVNSAGYPTKTELLDPTGPGRVTVFEISNTYNALNQVTGSLIRNFNGTALVNEYKDTIGYAGAMKNYSDRYFWDIASSSWLLHGEERRWMNAAGLPDSLWARYNYNAPKWDTSVTTLVYNANGNPVKGLFYESNNAAPDYEYRWYYEPVSNVNVKPVATQSAVQAYPNPAGTVLHLKGVTEGKYYIRNVAGQMVQTGTLSASGLPVGALAPGVYSISLQDKAGAVYATQFVRQ